APPRSRSPPRPTLSPDTSLFRSSETPSITTTGASASPTPIERGRDPPYTTYARPEYASLPRLAYGAPSTRSSKPSPLKSPAPARSEEHTSELQSRENLACRLLLA